ncbi:TPA: hypothetical protein ACWWCV_002680 [Enterococcus faecium]
MKLKGLLTTLITLSIFTGTSLSIAQSTSADTLPASSEERNDLLPQIHDVYLVHYNVLRIELVAPIDSKDAFVNLCYGEANQLGDVVIENNMIVAIDVNIDLFAKDYPTEEQRKEIVDSLHLMYVPFAGPSVVKIPVYNSLVKDTLITAVNYGGLLEPGKVGKASNVTKLDGYDKVIKGDPLATRLLMLNNNITTETDLVMFTIDPESQTRYTFRLKDQKGNVGGRATILSGEPGLLYVQPKVNEKFSSQKYTLAVKDNITGSELELASFTPFNIF